MRSQRPTDDDLYSAFCRKDMAFDGVAYIAVQTTGIFCRPGCPARMPLRRNVEFFRSAQEAQQAGFRACKRCRPLAPPASASGLVQRLLSELSNDLLRRWRIDDLRALEIDPVAARRHFRKRFGMSFLAYSRAQRLAAAHSAIGAGSDVINAQLDAGFDSSSGFREAFSQKFGQPPARARSSLLLRSEWIDTPIGTMIALTDDQSLHMLEFTNRKQIDRQFSRYRERLNAAFLPGETRASTALRRDLDAYFSGTRLTFSTTLSAVGTAFQQRVWTQLQTISPGETVSYGQLAKDIGMPAAVRAVANANAMNRCAIVIPCHRIVGADGTLTGYAGGLPRKQWLLDHERRHSLKS